MSPLIWLPQDCSKLILSIIKRASARPRTETSIMAVSEILAI